jgi:hypothetical protein
MKTLTPLYFPGTAIAAPDLFPLFLFFPRIHLLRPVEGSAEEDGSADSFMNSPFCQVHTPCPLGADRARFIHLVKDIAERGDEYPAQLSALTLASLSTTQASGEDSERAIIRSLQPSLARDEEELTRQRREKLWQARLVLAIGDLLDRQEAEIEREWSRLTDQEARLFRDLQGDDEWAEEGLPLFSADGPSGGKRNRTGNSGKRVAAWRQLYREAGLAHGDALLTTNRDAASLVLSEYERLTGKTEPAAISLPLPGTIGDGEKEALAAARDFTERHQPLLQRCHQALIGLAASPEKGLPEEDPCRDWQQQLALAFPPASCGRQNLRLHLLPEISCRSLFGSKTGPAAACSLLFVLD